MKRQKCLNRLLSILTLCMLPPMASAQSGELLDPVIISPEDYQLKFENDHVRVVEYEILPGEKEKWHIHPAKVAYVLSKGKLKVTTDNGESFVVNEGQGEVRWLGAVGKHYGENVGDTPIRIVFVEIKNIEQGAMDLTNYLEDEAGKKP